MQKTDLLRMAAAILWDGTGKRSPHDEVTLCAAIKRVGAMNGKGGMPTELVSEVLRRIAPHKDLGAWMRAKRPDQTLTPQAVQAHRKAWALRMAGLAPWPTPQAYKPRTRRR